MVQVTVALYVPAEVPLLETTVTPVAAVGLPTGVPVVAADANEVSPVTPLVTVTVTAYVTPLVSPTIVQMLVVVPEHERPPAVAVHDAIERLESRPF
jgi:hypothetical protein